MKYTQGGFTYQTLKNMPIGEYNALKYTINNLILEEEKEMDKAKKESENKAKGIGSGLPKAKSITR